LAARGCRSQATVHQAARFGILWTGVLLNLIGTGIPMHTHTLAQWQHSHAFLGRSHSHNERRALAVMALTGTMMVAEIGAGTYFGSMALLADGWHMGTHLGAMAITAVAYLLARRERDSRAFTFGTGKFGDLAGFSSALILALVSLAIGIESVTRLAKPVAINYDAALGVAALGLGVNLVSALLLKEDPNEEPHHHGAGHHDHNLRSAFLHVMADALTSVLALAALACGRQFGWAWMDPAMGIVGSVVIAVWSYGLLRDSSRVLLDREADPEIADHIRTDVETGGSDRVADLHLWRVGPGHYAAIVTVVTHDARSPDYYKALLSHHPELSHVTVEVQPCA